MAITQQFGPATSQDAFAKAEHWRRYAHRTSVVYQARDGLWYCLSYCREAIKRAMLAAGTKGKMFVIGEGPHGSMMRWREACIRLRTSQCSLTC